MKALVTGGCGFIGSHVVRALLGDGWQVVNLDALTYAANPNNLAAVANSSAYTFVHGDICDTARVSSLLSDVDLLLNFAAETHVDRSLLGPSRFVRTDVEGVVSLLESLRTHPNVRFIHMSTDEVFGPLEAPAEAREDDAFAPTSPYSASKAAAELQLRAYAASYGVRATVLRACNVYGPNQHVEKFIPLFITRALANQPLPLYGDGRQVREWLHVADLVSALRVVLRMPPPETLQALHIGSGERIANLDVAADICHHTGCPRSRIMPVEDRPGHDRRYALDCSRLRAMDWHPAVRFKHGLADTIDWYRHNSATWSLAFRHQGFEQYWSDQYADRLATP